MKKLYAVQSLLDYQLYRAVKKLSKQYKMSVSGWIRHVLEIEVELHNTKI